MSTDVVPILRVSDAAAAVSWYARLGFEQTFEHRFESHLPAYVGLRRDGAQIHLSEHAGDANPHGLVYVWVDDVDAVAAEFGWSGVVFTRQDILNQEIGPIEARVDGFTVRPLGRDAALVTYRSEQVRGPGHRSSVWVRVLGRWLLDFHQGTPIG